MRLPRRMATIRPPALIIGARFNAPRVRKNNASLLERIV